MRSAQERVVLRYSGCTVLDERTYTEKEAIAVGFYIGGGLPGPFSWSMRVPPRVKPPRRRPASRSSCSCNHQRPGSPRPQDRAIADTQGSVGGGILLWLLLISVVVLVILAIGGFRL